MGVIWGQSSFPSTIALDNLASNASQGFLF